MNAMDILKPYIDRPTEAQRQDPGVLDRVGAYWAEHPEVVKALGGTALAIARGRVATRLRR